MPTLLKVNGFKFFFYSNEHEPMHIHVLKGEEYAKISLVDLRVSFNNFKSKDLNFIKEIIKENQGDFIKAWREYFND